MRIHEIDYMNIIQRDWFLVHVEEEKNPLMVWRSDSHFYLVLTDGAYGKSDSLDVVSLECTGSESFLHQCLRVRADQCSVMAGVQCMGKIIFQVIHHKRNFDLFILQHHTFFVSVRGAWSLWSSWGDCSVTCENGTRTRTRVCNHPPPNFGGRECPDTDLEYKPCTMIMCPGMSYFYIFTFLL